MKISQNKIKTYHFNFLKLYNVSEPKPGSSKDNDYTEIPYSLPIIRN